MSTFNIMVMCLPYLAFAGVGLNFLLTALLPAWRGNDREKWGLYNLVNFLPTFFDSFLGQLGFARPGFVKRKPITSVDFDEKSAVMLYYVFAATFLFLGIGGLVMIVYRSAH